jgi:hypothetical protein
MVRRRRIRKTKRMTRDDKFKEKKEYKIKITIGFSQISIVLQSYASKQ